MNVQLQIRLGIGDCQGAFDKISLNGFQLFCCDLIELLYFSRFTPESSLNLANFILNFHTWFAILVLYLLPKRGAQQDRSFDFGLLTKIVAPGKQWSCSWL